METLRCILIYVHIITSYSNAQCPPTSYFKMPTTTASGKLYNITHAWLFKPQALNGGSYPCSGPPQGSYMTPRGPQIPEGWVKVGECTTTTPGRVEMQVTPSTWSSCVIPGQQYCRDQTLNIPCLQQTGVHTTTSSWNTQSSSTCIAPSGTLQMTPPPTSGQVPAACKIIPMVSQQTACTSQTCSQCTKVQSPAKVNTIELNANLNNISPCGLMPNINLAVKTPIPSLSNILSPCSLIPKVSMTMNVPNRKENSETTANFCLKAKSLENPNSVSKASTAINPDIKNLKFSLKPEALLSVPNPQPNLTSESNINKTVKDTTDIIVAIPNTLRNIATPTSTSVSPKKTANEIANCQCSEENKTPLNIPGNYVYPDVPKPHKTPVHACLAGYDKEIFNIINDIKQTTGDEIEVHFYIFHKCKFNLLGSHMTTIKALQEKLAKYHHYICLNKKYVETYKENENCWYIEKLIMIPSFRGDIELAHNFNIEDFSRLCRLKDAKSDTGFEPLVLEIAEKVKSKDVCELNNLLNHEDQSELVLDEFVEGVKSHNGVPDLSFQTAQRVSNNNAIPKMQQAMYTIPEKTVAEKNGNLKTLQNGVHLIQNRIPFSSTSYNNAPLGIHPSHQKGVYEILEYVHENKSNKTNSPSENNYDIMMSNTKPCNAIPLLHRNIYRHPSRHNYIYTGRNINGYIPSNYYELPYHDTSNMITAESLSPATNKNQINSQDWQTWLSYYNPDKKPLSHNRYGQNTVSSKQKELEYGQYTVIPFVNAQGVASSANLRYDIINAYTKRNQKRPVDETISYTPQKGINLEYDTISSNEHPKKTAKTVFDTITSYSRPEKNVHINYMPYASLTTPKQEYVSIDSYSQPQTMKREHLKPIYDSVTHYTKPQIKPEYDSIYSYTKPQRKDLYDVISSYTLPRKTLPVYNQIKSYTPSEKQKYDVISAYTSQHQAKQAYDSVTLSYLAQQKKKEQAYDTIDSYTPVKQKIKQKYDTLGFTSPKKGIKLDYDVIHSYTPYQTQQQYDILSYFSPKKKPKPKYDVPDSYTSNNNKGKQLYDEVTSGNPINKGVKEAYDKILSYSSPYKGNTEVYDSISAYSPKSKGNHIVYDSVVSQKPTEKNKEDYESISSYTTPAKAEKYEVLKAYTPEEQKLKLNYDIIETSPRKGDKENYETISSYSPRIKPKPIQYDTVISPQIQKYPSIKSYTSPDKIKEYHDVIDFYTCKKRNQPNYNVITSYSDKEKYDKLGSYTPKKPLETLSYTPNNDVIGSYTTPHKKEIYDSIPHYTTKQKPDYFNIDSYTNPKASLKSLYDRITSYTPKEVKPNYNVIQFYSQRKPDYETILSYGPTEKHDIIEKYSPKLSGNLGYYNLITKFLKPNKIEDVKQDYDVVQSNMPQNKLDYDVTVSAAKNKEYETISSYTPAHKPETYETISSYTTKPKQMYHTIDSYTKPQRNKYDIAYSSNPKEEYDNILAYSKPNKFGNIQYYSLLSPVGKTKLGLKYERTASYTHPKSFKQDYDSILSYTNKPATKYDKINEYSKTDTIDAYKKPPKVKQEYQTIQSYSQNRVPDYESILAYTPKRLDQKYNKIDAYTQIKPKQQFDRIGSYTDSKKTNFDYYTIDSHTDAQKKLKKDYDYIKSYTDSKKKPAQDYNTIDSYTDKQKKQKMDYDYIKSYTNTKKNPVQDYYTIDSYTDKQKKQKMDYDYIKSYTDTKKNPAQDYYIIDSYTDKQKKQKLDYDYIKSYTDTKKKPIQDYYIIDSYTDKQKKQKMDYDYIKSYTDSKRNKAQDYYTIDSYTPKQKKRTMDYDYIKSYTDSKKKSTRDYYTIDSYTDAQKKQEVHYDNIESYTDAKERQKQKYNTIDYYTGAQKTSTDKYHTIEYYTNAQKPKEDYQTIEHYTDEQKKAKLDYDKIDSYTKSQTKPKKQYQIIDSYTSQTRDPTYESILSYTQPIGKNKPQHETIDSYASKKSDGTQNLLEEMQDTITADQKEIDCGMRSRNEKIEAVLSDEENMKVAKENSLLKLIPNIEAIRDYITRAILSSLNLNADLTDTGKSVDIPLKDIVLEDKTRGDVPPMRLKTNDPNIELKGVISKLKILKPRLVFDTKEFEVANFIPIVKDDEKRAQNTILDIARNAVKEVYKEPIILNDPSKTKELLLSSVKSNNEKAFIWPACYKSNAWYQGDNRA